MQQLQSPPIGGVEAEHMTIDAAPRQDSREGASAATRQACGRQDGENRRRLSGAVRPKLMNDDTTRRLP